MQQRKIRFSLEQFFFHQNLYSGWLPCGSVRVSLLKQRGPRQLDHSLLQEEACPQSNTTPLPCPRASGMVAKSINRAFKIPASGTLGLILNELKDTLVDKTKVHVFQTLLLFSVTATEDVTYFKCVNTRSK